MLETHMTFPMRGYTDTFMFLKMIGVTKWIENTNAYKGPSLSAFIILPKHSYTYMLWSAVWCLSGVLSYCISSSESLVFYAYSYPVYKQTIVHCYLVMSHKKNRLGPHVLHNLSCPFSRCIVILRHNLISLCYLLSRMLSCKKSWYTNLELLWTWYKQPCSQLKLYTCLKRRM